MTRAIAERPTVAGVLDLEHEYIENNSLFLDAGSLAFKLVRIGPNYDVLESVSTRY